MADLFTADSEPEPLTHAALVTRAGQWLRKTAGCSIVFEELVALTGEIPDAIGWKSGISFLIECKVSRADFFAERSKPHRLEPTLGMGDYRYFMAPVGVLKVEDLPDRWGLLEVDTANRVHLRAGVHPMRYGPERASYRHKAALRSELYMLLSSLRRLQISLGSDEWRRLVHQSYSERERIDQPMFIPNPGSTP